MSRENAGRKSDGLFEGMLEALADKHSQLDVNLHDVSISLPAAKVNITVNGQISVTAHVRDLTEDERKASSSRNVALMSHA